MFAGRSTPLAELHDLLERGASAPQVAWVVGEAGIGKSTLVRHCLEQAGERQAVWVTADESETSLSFGLVDQLRAGLAPAVGAGVLGRPPARDAEPLSVGSALVRAFGAADQPLVVVLDDFQWADGYSAAALRFALRRLVSEPVVVVVVTRPDVDGTLGSSWQRFLSDPSHVWRVALEGFTVEEIIAFSERMGTGRLDLESAARLWSHTKGHPLYCRLLLEELSPEALNSPGVVLPAPSSLASLALARVAGLAADGQRLVEAGSVLGTAFALGLGAAVGHVAEPLAALEAAVAGGVLVREVTGEITFVHPLVRGAVYNDLSPSRRAALHQAAAIATSGHVSLMHRARATVGADEALAVELEALAVAELSSGQAPRCSEHLLMAASLSADPATRDRRLLEAVEALFSVQHHVRARMLRPETEACASSPFRAYVLGLMEVTGGRFEQAIKLFRDAIASSSDRGSLVRPGVDLPARARGGLAFALFMAGQYAEALDAAELALAGDVAWGLGVTSYVRAMCVMELGRAEQLDALMVSLAEEGSAASVADLGVLSARGLLSFMADEPDGAVADLATVARRAKDGERAQLLPTSLASLSEAEYRLGRWDDAAVHAELALSVAEDSDQPTGLVFAHAASALLCAGRGRFELADHHVVASTELAEAMRSRLGRIKAAVAHAMVAQAQGDQRRLLDASVVLWEGAFRHDLQQMSVWRWRALVVEGLTGVGELDRASEVLADLESFVASRGLSSAGASLALLRGRLAEARDDPEAAEEAYGAFVDAPRRGREPLAVARLRVAQGSALRRAGHYDEAAVALGEAHRILSDLRAVPYLTRCNQELALLDPGADGVTPVELSALTPREEAVSSLVGEGLSNPEIAERLYVSTKTVEYHLTNVYAKVGVRSRRQLRARLRGEAVERPARDQ